VLIYKKRVALRFEGKNQLNIPFAKCEVFGCVTTLNNNTKEKVALAVFDKIKKGLEDSTFLEIAVQGFTDKPVVIKTSLVGFKDAYNNLNSKIN
jgi:invasion protein IalB